MEHNPGHHFLGLASLCAAAGFLVGLPLVAVDTRASSRAAYENRPTLAPDADALLLFAGFPGCQGACPVALAQLAGAQDMANEEFGHGKLAVVFVNLHLDIGDAGATAYARSFHPDFHGRTAGASAGLPLNNLLAQQGGRSVADLSRHRGNVYQYERNGRSWALARVYPTVPSRETLLSAVRDTLRSTKE